MDCDDLVENQSSPNCNFNPDFHEQQVFRYSGNQVNPENPGNQGSDNIGRIEILIKIAPKQTPGRFNDDWDCLIKHLSSNPLFHQHHLLRPDLCAGLEPVEIQSARHIGGVELDRIISGRFGFVNQRRNFLSQRIPDTEPDVGLRRN